MGATLTTLKNSLNAGELAPGIWARQDLEKYAHGSSTSRNFFCNYRGGVSSRAGLAYVGTCKQQYPIPPRDIPFQFSLNQGYVLEFGELYMRVKFQGAYVVENEKVITGVSPSAVFTSSSHGYSVGDWVYMTTNPNSSFNNQTWIIASVPSSNTFTVTDLFGVLQTSFSGSFSNGSASRVYTAASPYHAVDLPYLKYTQSADVMTLTCVNTSTSTEYSPYSLARISNTDWTFTPDTFASGISSPTSLTAVAQSSGTVTTWYSYVVTAVDNSTGEESNPSTPVNVQNVDISINLGSNTLTWAEVSGASSYNVYASIPSYTVNVPVSSLYGYVGTALGPSFTDTNVTPDFTQVPPTHTDPFARGTVSEVNVTAGGNGDYSQQTIGWSVTTSTGSGFTGTPVVNNGNLAGFVITDPGKNYQPGDTIAFTDSGGGLATGHFTITSLPGNAQTFTLNNVVISFSDVPVLGPDANVILVPIEANTTLTAQSVANYLNAQTSVSLSLSVAQYTSSGNEVFITYKTPGTVGNTYTMGTGSAPVTISGATLTGGGTVGSGATATLSISPESGTYPAVAAYYQQRRVYGSSLNNPDTYWMTQPGLFSNMDSSIPVTDADAITGTPWGQQVNGIQFMVPMPGGLVILTGKGAWQLNGGGTAALTPSNQVATPQAYNGCNGLVPPITVNYDILYVQSKGSIFRDLAYNFFTNIYTGTDLTTLSSHLFTDYSMVQAAYAEEPYKLVWVVRNDGVLLCLTYLKDQEVSSWSRHDTNGLFVGVVSITEPPVDAVYVITQRYVQGGWRYYSERMDDRTWNDVEDAYCVDAGLASPMNTFPYTLTITGGYKLGDTVSLTTTGAVFSSGSIGEIVRVGGGKIQITGYNTGTSVTGLVTQTITSVIPNDPSNTVEPAAGGTWSVSPVITQVTNLNHLNGLTVTGLADGSVIPPQVVVNNTVTLPNPASQVLIGLPYTCQVQTVYWDHESQQGTAQNRFKNITAAGVRVEASRGIQVGADQPDSSTLQNYPQVTWTDMNEIKERTNQVFAGSAVPLFTGDYYKTVTSGWNLKGQVAVQQVYPLPANILGIIFYVTEGSDK